MKHILYYIGVLGSGGIESTTISIFKNIDRKVIAIDFVVDSPEYLINKAYEGIIHECEGRIFFLSEYSNRPIASKLSKIIAFKNLFREINCDAIHFHVSYPSSMMYALLARFVGLKNVFTTSHAKGTSNTNKLFLLSQYVSRHILPFFVSKRFAVSDEAGKWCYGNTSFEVIPNGVELSRFKYNKIQRDEVRKELNIPSDYLLVGHIGRFVKDKNHDFIIDVFADYCRNNPKSKLLLIGEGVLKNGVVDKCRRYGISEKVIILPFTSAPEKYLWAMDIFLFPSLAEGFGMAAVEAQAASLPVIASENVPQKTNVSDLITYLPLDTMQWVTELSKCYGVHRNLAICNRLQSYDAKCISKKIEEAYLK